jgi:hypothetical protein
VPAGVDLVLLPGLCEGDVDAVARATGVATRKGPKDLREIPAFFGRAAVEADYGSYDIEILAEINNAPKLTRRDLRAAAEAFRQSGADVIDIGCTPGLPFPALGDVVRELRGGLRISVDSFDPAEIRRLPARTGARVNGRTSCRGDLRGAVPAWWPCPSSGSLDTLDRRWPPSTAGWPSHDPSSPTAMASWPRSNGTPRLAGAIPAPRC